MSQPMTNDEFGTIFKETFANCGRLNDLYESVKLITTDPKERALLRPLLDIQRDTVEQLRRLTEHVKWLTEERRR